MSVERFAVGTQSMKQSVSWVDYGFELGDKQLTMRAELVLEMTVRHDPTRNVGSDMASRRSMRSLNS